MQKGNLNQGHLKKPGKRCHGRPEKRVIGVGKGAGCQPVGKGKNQNTKSQTNAKGRPRKEYERTKRNGQGIVKLSGENHR